MAGSNQRAGWAQRMKGFQFKQADINRFIMHYLVTEGYKEAAQRFEAEAKLESGAQPDTVEDHLRIRNAVLVGQVQYAIDLAKKLYPKLCESNNYMYFHMQQLRLIELIRERKLEHAVHLAQSQHEGALKMEHALALLSLQRPEMSTELNAAIFKYQPATSWEPKMLFLVKLILWAQGKLDSNAARPDLDSDDFELEVLRALQSD